MPMSLYALGLGEMTVESSLDQPFLAEIELIDVGNIPLTSIRVGLADPENFEQIGIERTAVLSLLNFKIEKNSRGKLVIKVHSLERMTEPYMELVVDLTWPKGQLYKAYTVLLDPPGYQLVSTTAQSSPTHYKNKNVSTYANEPGVINKTVITTVDHNPVNVNDSKKKATYGPTITNESVWQIAQRYKTSDVILPQIVLAIVGANPDAFNEGNLNGLKVGVRLVIPSTQEIMQVPADLATEEVMAHDKAWNEKTVINHVIAPPYMSSQTTTSNNTNTQTSAFAPSGNNSQLPPIPKLNMQTVIKHTSVPLPLISADALVGLGNTGQQPVQQYKVPQSTEQDAKTKAELSITTAAVESVRESNAVLMEQLRLMQEQNRKLQQQLDKRDQELETIRKQMQVIITDRQSVASQSSSSTANDSSSNVWLLLLLLVIAAGGGGFAYWDLRIREQNKNNSPYSTEPPPVEPNPFMPAVEPVAEKKEEVTTPPSANDALHSMVEPVTSDDVEDKAETSNNVEQELESKTPQMPVDEPGYTEVKTDETQFENQDDQQRSEQIDLTEDTDNKAALNESIEVNNDDTEVQHQEEVHEQIVPEETSEHAAEELDSLEFDSVRATQPAVLKTTESVQTFEEALPESKDEFKTEQSMDYEPVIKAEPKNELVEQKNEPEQSEQTLSENEFLSAKDSDREQPGEPEDADQKESDSGMLEFESGLHELLKDKPEEQSLKTKTDNEPNEEDKGMDFVSALSVEKEDTKQLEDNRIDDVNKLPYEGSEDTNEKNDPELEFKKETDVHDDAELVNQNKELDKNITEFFVDPEMENKVEHTDSAAEESALPETENESKTSNPLKSKKALDTLLALAKTYISMDDTDSAIQSLEEVIEHGNKAQKEEAKKLLEQIKNK